MSKNLRWVTPFVAGLLLGAVLAAWIVARHWQATFADLYVIQVAGQADVAYRIASGKAEALKTQILDQMPDACRVIEEEYRQRPGTDSTLRLVQDAYSAAGRTPEPEVQAIFDALPPRPCCR